MVAAGSETQSRSAGTSYVGAVASTVVVHYTMINAGLRVRARRSGEHVLQLQLSGEAQGRAGAERGEKVPGGTLTAMTPQGVQGWWMRHFLSNGLTSLCKSTLLMSKPSWHTI